MSLFSLLDNETPEQAKQTQKNCKAFLKNINKTKINTMNSAIKRKKESIEKTIERLNKQLKELKELNQKEIEKTMSSESFSNQNTINILMSNADKLVQINLLK